MPTYDVDVAGLTYEVDAPDENTAWRWANYEHRKRLAAAPQGPKESTIGSELARGFKQLVSTSRTGIGALTEPEEAARAGVERGRQIAAEAGEGPSFAALRKVYEEQGLLPAVGELASQVPRALAGQAAQLGAMAGGAKLGAMAGSAVLPGPGTFVGGVLGAGATLLPQFFGANVERQAAEQMERGEPVSIDRGTAAAAAAGQAGIEAAGTAFVLGKRVVKGLLGITDDAALATAKAREELVKAATRSRLGAAGRGAAVGLAEIPVEIAQAVIERAQAGLDVLSPEALSEYGENAYLAGLVGPTIGGATRVTEPGAARRTLAVEEQEEAAAAAKTAREAEAAEKASPEYALKLDADYQAAVAKMRELQTAVKQKPAKDADPSQWAEYNQKVTELKEFTANTMRPLTAEYTPRKAEIAKLKEQQRVAGMTPEDFFLEQLGVKPATERATEEATSIEELVSTVPPAPELSPLDAYVQERVSLADQQLSGTADATDYVAYLMQDPEMARQLVKNQTPIPGVKKKVNNTILSGLKVQLKEYDAQRAAERAKASEALRQRQLMAQTAEQEEAAYLEEQRLDEALRGEEAETMRTKVSPEMAALQRIGARYTPGVRQGETPLSSLVDQLVDVAQPEKPAPSAEVKTPARFVAGTPEIATLKERQVLQNQIAYAKAVGDKATVADLQGKLDAMGVAPEAERGALTEEEPTTRVAGVERPLSPGAKAANVLTRMSQAQMRAFEDLKLLLEQLRNISSERLEPLRSAVDRRVELAKRNVVGAALNELDARREALGQPKLDTQETTQLVGQLNGLLNELVSRSSRFMEQPLVSAQAAQMRGTQLVRGAQEEVRPPVGQRTFKDFDASATALRTDMRDAIEAAFGAAPATPAEKRPETVKRQRFVTPEEQKPLFLTYSSAEEAEPYVEDLFNRAYARKDLSEEDRQLLEKLDAVYSALPAEEQKLVSEQVGRVASGRTFDAPYALETVLATGEASRKPISEEAKAAQGQRELFAAETISDEERGLNARIQALDAQIEKERSTTRAKGLEQLGQLTGRDERLASLERQRAVLQARLDLLPADRKALMAQQRALAETTEGIIRSTPEAFQRFLRSKKAMEMRLKAATEQAAKAEKAAETAKTKTQEVVAAPENLQVLLAKAKDATETASIIRMYIEDRLRPMFTQENALSEGLLQIDAQLFGGFEKQEIIVRGKPTTTSRRKTEEGLLTKFEALEKQYGPLLAAYRSNAELRNTSELNLLASGIPQQLFELKTRIDFLKERRADIAERLDLAIKMREKVRQDALNAEATVKAFAEEKQAVDAYKNLNEKLSAQTALMNARMRGTQLLAAERAKEKKAVSPLAEIEARVVDTTRVFRDTNAPEVVAEVNKQKRVIALNEAKLETAQKARDAAKNAGDTEEAQAYEDQIKEYTRNAEAAQERMYAALNNAPLKRVTAETRATEKAAEETDAKERQTVFNQMKAFYTAAGMPVPQMPASYRGPVVTAAAGEPGALRTGSKESREGKTATPVGLAPKKEATEATITRAREAAPKSDAAERFAKAKAEIDALSERIKTVEQSAPTTKEGAKKKRVLLQQLKAKVKEQGTLAAAARKEMTAEATAFYGSKKAYKGLQTETRRTLRGQFGAQQDLARTKKQLENLQAKAPAESATKEVKAAYEREVKKLKNRINTLDARLAEYEAEMGALSGDTGGQKVDLREPIEPTIGLSRGPTAEPSTTASVRKELSATFPDLGRVQIFDSVEALVEANPQYEGRIPDDARGFVDSAGNKAFLIAENINKGDSLAVLLHEVGAHIGLKNMLGAPQYNALVKAVETWAKRNDGSPEARVAKAAQERVKAAKTPANQKDDETLAYAIEEAVKAGVTPTQTKSPLGQWLARIAQAFRKALEKFGLPPKALDAQGLVDMAFGAAKVEMVEGKASTGKGDLLFTYAGERSGIAAEALKEAKDMVANGAPMEEVWNKTGWFQSADKKWRFEIDDSKAQFKFDDYYEALKEGNINDLGQVVLELGNILWHPALYKAYPGLKTLPVKLDEDSSSGELGAFGPDGITLNMAYHDPEGVLLHELQHYIQRQEGFTRGTSSTAQYLRAYNLNVLKSVRESYARMAEEATGIEKDLYERRVDAFDAGIDAAQDARAEAVKKLKTAAKEWRQAQASTSSELDALEKEYKDGVEASEKAFDDYIAASTAYSSVLKERNSTKAERDAAKAAVEAAEKTRKATQRPSTNAYFAARDAVYAKRQAAHNVFLEVRSSNKDDIATAVETTIIAMLPKNSVFAKFAKLSIAEQAYQNMLGEIEARDVEERRKLSAEERAATRPYASQPQRQEEILFSRNLPTASRVADQIIGKQPTVLGRIKKSLFGLSFRTQIIDNLAPLEHIARTSMDALNGAQMMYYLRKYGMRNHMTAEAIENGVAQVKTITRADGQKERVIEAVPGANIKTIVKRLAAKDVVKEAGSADAANRLFTLYMSAIRGENKGFDKLNFGRAAALSELQKIERELASPRLEPQDKTPLNARKAYLEKNLDTMPTEADFRAAKAEIDANPTLKKAFDEAREMYNEYNTDLLNFLVQTGAVSKDEAARLLRAKDYIPYYRMRGGNAELMIGGETPIRIGNLKDSPHLQELVGGEEPIFDFLTSSVQNTSMLLDMGLRNIAAKNVAYELADAGLASKPAKVGKAGAPKGTVEFKLDGEDYFVRVDTDYIGVPSDLLVKGMAGIPTMLPQGLRLLGIPAQVLRRAVTSTPVFAAKQLFRDSLSAYLLSGSDAPPLLSAVNQLRKASPLKARGITGGQTFTGTTEDMSRLLKEVQEGRPGWMKAFAKMEALAHKADAATRQSQYESYRAQGLSDMEAELMALESMNFSKRGLSPTMHMASMLVPFLNAQIQGLDVLYKALTGNMPFNDKLDLQRKLFTRGASMFALTLAYAAAMQDDEEYKNATPDQKYGNWFLRLPFLDEMAGEKVTLRVPIPFEVGYIFKALPEMLYNSMKSDQGAKEALDALNHILIQIVPGGSSMVPIEIGGAKIPVPVPIPAALKPLIEVGLGKSFFTGRDLESAREQAEVPGMRYRERTSEIAKYIGQSVNFSPIKIEALVNGYTGGLGLLMLQTLSLPLPKAAVAVPEKRWSELPLVGSMFQPADASNIIDGVYKDFQKVRQAKTTYDRLLERGETGKAQAFLQQNMPLIMLNQMAGEYRQTLGELTENERIVRGSKLTEEEKRKLLDRIKAAKIQIATSVRAALDRKTPQAALA